MGKHRRLMPAGGQEDLLPPPPPLQPRPGIAMVTSSTPLQFNSYCYPLAVAAAAAAAAAATASAVANDADDVVDDFDDQVKKESGEDSNEPLDYTMKRLASSPSPPASLASVGSAASPALATPTAPIGGGSGGDGGGDDLLHKLRNRVLQKRGRPHTTAKPQVVSLQTLPFVLQARQRHPFHVAGVNPTKSTTSCHQLMQPTDSETELRAAYAAGCIKSRLDGCGKRVHLFLGILLHFGMPPGPDGEQIFERVIAFSDENKNLCDRPTPYFMVLDSKLLALIWCKFKGNSSNEYSTLTRAIRSTRQKYKGIFEAVENPGKKLYRFGSIALQQFQQLFPGSYASAATACS